MSARITPQLRAYVAYAMTLIALVGCSANVTPSAPALVTTAPTAAASPASLQKATALFTITVPAATGAAAKRTRNYISTATQSVIITLTAVGGTTYAGTPNSVATNLTIANSNCTGSPLTCKVIAPAVAGNDTFTIVTYDEPQPTPAAGTPAGRELSRASLIVTVTAGVANTVKTPLVLDGIVDSIMLTFGQSTITGGTPSAIPLMVAALDNDGRIIVSGNYVDANGDPLTVAITDADSSNDTSPSTATITGPTSGITLNYNGADTFSQASVGATVSGGTINGVVGGSTITIAAPTVALSQLVWISGSSTSSTFTEALTGTNFVAGSGATTLGVASGAAAVSNVTVTGSTTATATLTVPANASSGTYAVTLTTAGGSGTASLALMPGQIVSSTADTVPGTPLGTGTGASGDLRYALQNTPNDGAIVFACGSPCTVTLAGPLPPVDADLTIDGGSNVVVDGASAYRAFFLDGGTTTLEDLTIQNALASGGAGASSSDGAGGGGLGAGACVFVNTATATLRNLRFSDCTVKGGSGGQSASATTYTGVGGGGMGAAGGSSATAASGNLEGGGGGGILTPGVVQSDADGNNGGGGGAGYGGSSNGTMGAAYTPDDTAGENNNVGGGGNGGFGGGGGGGGGAGGTGGFGGGGGGSEYDAGGAGGPGGGGGGSQSASAASGGALATISGGASGTSAGGPGSAGGGGAAAGPAIFVLSGNVTIAGATATGSSAMPGPGGEGSSSSANGSPGIADATPVFNYEGTVNGSTSAGPVANAFVRRR